jgi:hypothetical protein
MDATEIFKSLNGFLWDYIDNITPDEYIEPVTEVGPVDFVLGPMIKLEKVLFSINNSVFFSLLPFFRINEDDDGEMDDFYTWLIETPQIDFLGRFLENHPDEEDGAIDEATALILRNNFIASYDFLEIVTCQRFSLFPEDVFINYRKGYMVATTDCKLFAVSDN